MLTQTYEAIVLAPTAKLRDGRHIGRARVLVADRGGKEFEEAFAGLVAGAGDDRRHRKLRWKHGGEDLVDRLGHKLHVRG
jgi:hypothetical protein